MSHDKKGQKLEMDGNFLNLKGNYEKLTADILLNERLKISPYHLEQARDACSHHCYSTRYWMHWPQ